MGLEKKDNITIGIVGAGTMGRGIAQVAALSGMRVMLYDTNPGAIVSAKQFIEDMVNKAVIKEKITKEQANTTMSLIETVDTLTAFSSCDVVIEAVVEDFNVKKDIFKKLEEIVSDNCIITTNTSSLSVTAIASVCKNPKRVAGFHFFNPVPVMKLVEVVRGLATGDETINILVDLATRMDHVPVVTKDAPGFIVNHIGRGYGTESLAILSENIADAYQIDIILKQSAGFKMGPFELFDLTGLDISHTATEAIYNQFYHDPRYRPSFIAQNRLDGGLLGRKTGKGFYEYKNGKPLLHEKPKKEQNIDIKGAKFWVDNANKEGHDVIVSYLRSINVGIDTGAKPDEASVIVVSPIAEDATTTAINGNFDPERLVAVDTLMGFDKHRTIMSTPITNKDIRELACAVFSLDGVTVDLINDSPGFIVGRVIAMIVNIGCNVAEKGIATPEAIDLAVKLGLNYPFGPLEWGDKIGALKILSILKFLYNFYGDPRYRPSPWLTRRALLGIPLSTKVQ